MVGGGAVVELRHELGGHTVTSGQGRKNALGGRGQRLAPLVEGLRSRRRRDQSPRSADPPQSPVAPGWAHGAVGPAAERYLGLLMACLTRSGFGEPQPEVALGDDLDPERRQVIEEYLSAHDLCLVPRGRPDPAVRQVGKDWPTEAETMIGMERLLHLARCSAEAVRQGVPGDLLEAGVWRGGACILMRGVLAATGSEDRRVWVADSFEGLPKPDPERYPADEGDRHWTFTELAVGEEAVRTNFARYGLLDDQVRFLRGWFNDTLPSAPVERLAVLRVDGDMYGSTMEVLEALYDKLSVGGYCIIDDYGAVAGCRAAVGDFRARRGVTEPIEEVDWTGVYWRKGG